MNILVTGKSGILGSTLSSYFEHQGSKVSAFEREKFSWRNCNANLDYFSQFDFIVHAAANTNVEVCELDPVSCYKDNTLLTERIAFFASQVECKFVYISSTGIYGTEKPLEPYTEYDSVNPTTHHHRAKWLAEQAVNRHFGDALIVRAGWIFGGSVNHSKNFVAKRIDEAMKSDEGRINSNVQQRGVPTSADDLSKKLYELLKNGESGTFNLVNQGSASRFEYVSKIVEFAGLNVEVAPTDSREFKRIAPVSDNETAIALRLEQLGYESLPDWKESLRRYIESQKSSSKFQMNSI